MIDATPVWALVSEADGSIVISFDAFCEMDVSAESQVSSEPVEKGSFATYNKAASPTTIAVKLAKGGTYAEQQQTLEELDTLCTGVDLVSLITPSQEYTPYSLESYNYRRTEKDGAHLLTVELKLVEVREVETQARTTATHISQKSSKDASNASATDTGKTQARQPYNSVLSAL